MTGVELAGRRPTAFGHTAAKAAIPSVRSRNTGTLCGKFSHACLAKVYPMAWTKFEKPSLSPEGIRSKAGAPKHLLGITGAVDLDGAGHGLNLIKIVGCECDRERPQILIQAVERPRTKQRNDP